MCEVPQGLHSLNLDGRGDQHRQRNRSTPEAVAIRQTETPAAPAAQTDVAAVSVPQNANKALSSVIVFPVEHEPGTDLPDLPLRRVRFQRAPDIALQVLWLLRDRAQRVSGDLALHGQKHKV